ncbi:MAG: CoA transferase [Bacteroidales bacterium]|nr:CoA transferase [Bacteroidales bacterium]
MLPFPTDSHPLLHGVRVIEAARILAGPFCGQTLADLGADVIKLERPGKGDDTRSWGPPFLGELSAYFLSCNRNKRSVELDFADPSGQAILHRLLAKSDILIENFRSDSAEKLGLAPEALLAQHPRLIVCSISGYGRTGPLRERAGYDFAIQAQMGLMAITGPVEGSPFKVGVAIADVLTGLYAATAILAALRARERSGHGYAIDLALADCALASQVNVAQAYRTTGTMSPRQGNGHLQIVPYNLFPTADGWLVVNVGNDGQWRTFCAAVGEPEFAARYPTNPDRVQHREAVDSWVASRLRTTTTADWQKRLTNGNIPHAVVRDYATAFADPQAQARGMSLTVRDPAGNPVDLVGSPFHITGAGSPIPTAPPRLGADTTSVLRELLGEGDTPDPIQHDTDPNGK